MKSRENQPRSIDGMLSSISKSILEEKIYYNRIYHQNADNNLVISQSVDFT